MKAATVLLALVGATDALVAPRQQSAPARRRAVSQRASQHKLIHTPAPGIAHANFASVEAAQAADSTQGGAVVAVAGVKLATGTFTVPYPDIPTTPPLGAEVYTASFWLGIDGVSACPAAGLRAGVDIFNDDQTGVDAQAWFQWYPLQDTVFGGNFSVAPGDSVRITTTAASATSGSVLVENLSSGVSASHDFAAADVSAHPLCQSEAAWVVEDAPLEALPDVPSPFANFTSVVFSSVRAVDGSHKTVRLDTGAAAVSNIEVEGEGGQLTDCKVVSGSVLECDRVAIASS